MPWTYVINDLKDKEIVRTGYKKNCKNTNQKEFRVEKVIKWKGINIKLNGKALIILLTVGLIKKT